MVSFSVTECPNISTGSYAIPACSHAGILFQLKPLMRNLKRFDRDGALAGVEVGAFPLHRPAIEEVYTPGLIHGGVQEYNTHISLERLAQKHGLTPIDEIRAVGPSSRDHQTGRFYGTRQH